jgi:hypothetical protein
LRRPRNSLVAGLWLAAGALLRTPDADPFICRPRSWRSFSPSSKTFRNCANGRRAAPADALAAYRAAATLLQ